MSTTFIVPIPSRLQWRLIFSYDNSNNSGTIEHDFRTKIFQSFDVSTYTNTVTTYAYTAAEEQGISVTAGGAFEELEASVGANFENSSEVQDYVSTQQTTQSDHTYTSEYSEVRKYVIGPHSKLELYQLYFITAGVEYACNALRTKHVPDIEFNIDITVKQWRLITDVEVVFGDNAGQEPPDSIKEIQGRDTDINQGFGGKFVWLVPKFTYVVKDSTSSYKIRIQDHQDPSKPDLANGAGGDYRYLDIEKNEYQPRKIVNLTLLRSASAQDNLQGWSGLTIDINQGRGGDYLYLAWKSIVVSDHDLKKKGGKEHKGEPKRKTDGKF